MSEHPRVRRAAAGHAHRLLSLSPNLFTFTLGRVSPDRRETFFFTRTMPSAVSACAPLEDGPSLNATAAVLEVKPFHYEVLPTAVRLLQAAGAAHVSLLLRNNKNNREYDAVAQMQVWAPVRVLRHGSQIAAYLRVSRPSLILVNTFDDLISDRRGGRNGSS